MLDQKQHKTSSLYGQYEVTPTRGKVYVIFVFIQNLIKSERLFWYIQWHTT